MSTTEDKSNLLTGLKPDNLKSNSSEVLKDSNNTEDRMFLITLRKEIERRKDRIAKKITKIHEQSLKVMSKKQKEINEVNEQIEDIEESKELELSAEKLKEAEKLFTKLKELEEQIKEMQMKKEYLLKKIMPQIIELELHDLVRTLQAALVKEKNKPGKKQVASRKPYHTYLSKDNIEIRVGRSAADNDELSTNPAYRDNNDWWLHTAGVAGSHVVIRYQQDDLLTNYKETVYDAATLAAVNSKASQSGRIQITLARCRNISKPSSAKPGLVYLNGDVRTINIDLRVEKSRLERLQKIQPSS